MEFTILCYPIDLNLLLKVPYFMCFILSSIELIFWHCQYLLGQIELFSHVPVLKNFVEHLKRKNFNVCVVYLLDSQVPTHVF